MAYKKLTGIEPSSSIDIRSLGGQVAEDAAVVIDDACNNKMTRRMLSRVRTHRRRTARSPEAESASSDDSSYSNDNSSGSIVGGAFGDYPGVILLISRGNK